MIAAHKAESGNEEAHDVVRARSTMPTDPIEGTTELGNQVTKLMATLTRAGQENSPFSTQNSPRQRVLLLATPAPIMAKLVWDRQPWSAEHLSDVAGGPHTSWGQGQNTQGLRRAPQTGRIPAPSSASDTRVWVIWLRNVPPQPKLETCLGGTKGMWPNSQLAPATTAHSRPPAFPPWP